MPDRDAIRVLLIEDDAAQARLIREYLDDASPGVELHHVDRLAVGIEWIASNDVDAVLLDMSLPDSHGRETVRRFKAECGDLPVVVLTGHDDDSIGVQAVQDGAQDYLVKDRVDGAAIERSLRYAIERARLLAEQRERSLLDELTALYNRRGLMAMIEQHMKLAARTQNGMVLVFADVDNMKQINDRFGHREGDRALRDVAEILQDTFRESDVVARVGGDEFAVLAVEALPVADAIIAGRLHDRVQAHNLMAERPYELEMSVGMAHYDPLDPISAEELLAIADRSMYDNKRAKDEAKDGAAST